MSQVNKKVLVTMLIYLTLTKKPEGVFFLSNILIFFE